MTVLMDLEWVKGEKGHCSPTQVAARRVDSTWNTVDDFYARMKPQDETFHQWDHVAYSGGTPEDFLSAKEVHEVLKELKNWLRPDDILCWWFGEPKNVFQKINATVLGEKSEQKSCILSDYIGRFLPEKTYNHTNPYKIAVARNIPVPSPMHDARNDVEVLQKLLQAVHFPEYALVLPTRKLKKLSTVQNGLPYQCEVETGLVHKRGCGHIPEGAIVQGFGILTNLLRPKYKPCSYCLQEEYRQAKRERNKETIRRSYYNFVYTSNSKVFHRYDCPLILSAADIAGSIYYKKCAETGRHPCKLCHPTPNDPLRIRPKEQRPWGQRDTPVSPTPPKKTNEGYLRPTQAQETRRDTPISPTPPKKMNEAYLRLMQAQEARRSGLSEEGLSETKKDDILTLTNTGYGFWAGAGYQNFHLYNCPKLKGLTHIRGFARYRDATREGLTPCKCCKPTEKHDVLYSIPITSRVRENETVEDMVTLCKQYSYPYEQDKTYFTFLTAVGRWRIHLDSMPIALDHINLTRTPDNPYLYHKQPRLFLSLQDAFRYIQRHDQELQKRVKG